MRPIIQLIKYTSSPVPLNYHYCRFWSNTPPEDRTPHVTQDGCSTLAFKLSDQGLWPVSRRAKSATAHDDGLTVIGPSLLCNNELDIFEYLDLAYVPPHMRW